MIVYPMFLLVIVPLVTGIESLFAKKENARGRRFWSTIPERAIIKR